MADLQSRPCPIGKLHELPGLRQVGGQRLLNQRMNAIFEEVGRDAEMEAGWHRDGHGIHVVDEHAMIRNPFCLRGLGDLLALSLVRVRDGDQFDAGQLGHNPRVMAAKSADSDDGHS